MKIERALRFAFTGDVIAITGHRHIPRRHEVKGDPENDDRTEASGYDSLPPFIHHRPGPPYRPNPFACASNRASSSCPCTMSLISLSHSGLPQETGPSRRRLQENTPQDSPQ